MPQLEAGDREFRHTFVIKGIFAFLALVDFADLFFRTGRSDWLFAAAGALSLNG
jgi:hypothetical protein